MRPGRTLPQAAIRDGVRTRRGLQRRHRRDCAGCRLGFKHLAALPQYRMPDRYVNRTRPSLPAECKVSDQVETLLRVCERVILLHGGERIELNGQTGFRVGLQEPRGVTRLTAPP